MSLFIRVPIYLNFLTVKTEIAILFSNIIHILSEAMELVLRQYVFFNKCLEIIFNKK